MGRQAVGGGGAGGFLSSFLFSSLLFSSVLTLLHFLVPVRACLSCLPRSRPAEIKKSRERRTPETCGRERDGERNKHVGEGKGGVHTPITLLSNFVLFCFFHSFSLSLPLFLRCQPGPATTLHAPIQNTAGHTHTLTHEGRVRERQTDSCTNVNPL